MALSWRTACAIPYLPDYAAAAKHEAETKPIRGDEEKRKPLGRRDQKYRQIKRLEDGSIGLYEWDYSRLKQPFIQYMPNGDIRISEHGNWCKATYHDVLWEVLHLRAFTENHRTWVHYDGGVAALQPPQRIKWSQEAQSWVELKPKPEPSIFRRNERGNLVYINPPKIIKHVVDRRGAKAVRMRYMAALGYIEALTKLRKDDAPAWGEMARAFPERFGNADEMQEAIKNPWRMREQLPSVGNRNFKREHAVAIAALMASEDPGNHYRAYLWLHQNVTSDGVMRNAERVIAWAHRDEWFTEREVEAGCKAHDAYEWAFKN